MASRAKTPRADEDALDPVEAADVEAPDDADEGLLELEEPGDLDEDDDDGDADDDELELDADDDEPADALDDEPAEALDDADEDVGAVVLKDAAFDDDDDDVVAVAVDLDLDDGDEIEGVRDGEFVCRRCHMAKRETQLADAERLLCRDCA